MRSAHAGSPGQPPLQRAPAWPDSQIARDRTMLLQVPYNKTRDGEVADDALSFEPPHHAQGGDRARRAGGRIGQCSHPAGYAIYGRLGSVAAAARRARHPRSHRADDGPQPRGFRDWRRARARRRDRRSRPPDRPDECPDHGRPRHDLHAWLHRHALASLDKPVPALCQGRRQRARLLPREQPPGPALRRPRTATAA